MSVNPRFYKGSALPELEWVSPKAGDTWQAGQLARQSDSGWVVCLSDATSINGMFAATQASASVAATKVPVYRINSANQLFVMDATSGGTDTKAPATVVGNSYGLGTNSCVCTVNLQNDTGGEIYVYARLADKESIGNDTSDVPGKLICGIVGSVLTAEGL
jgi:hypothetical protein